MAVPAGTFQTFQAIGNREDLVDAIYNVSPTETPFLSMTMKTKATASLHEWQAEDLAAVNSGNAVVEGDDAANQTIASTSRLTNYVQTSEKTIGISTIQEVVNKAGRESELARQMVNYGLALRRDMETILTTNQAPVAGNASTARKLRPLEGWYATNDSRGAAGADGTTSAAATDGTQRNFTEALFKSVLQLVYASSSIGEGMFVMAGPANRANLSSQLSGGSTKFYRVESKSLTATVTVYQSDFGDLKFVPNRFQRDRTMHFINPEYAAVSFLEKFREQDLAITGLAKRKQIWSSYTLEMRNEKAHGVLADLNTAVL
jgi:Family of unknown function (DUF5309)